MGKIKWTYLNVGKSFPTFKAFVNKYKSEEIVFVAEVYCADGKPAECEGRLVICSDKRDPLVAAYGN
jgi:hypothetical protein